MVAAKKEDTPDFKTCTSGSPPISYIRYRDQSDLPRIQELIERDLSEPYSIFTYRYFIDTWPELALLALNDDTGEIIGCIVSKIEHHKSEFVPTLRGYIGMLAVDHGYRGRGIAKTLVELTLRQMRESKAEECILETELTNLGAIGLYESVGFVRHKRLPHYYLNGVDAFRYKYCFANPDFIEQVFLQQHKELSEKIKTLEDNPDDPRNHISIAEEKFGRADRTQGTV